MSPTSGKLQHQLQSAVQSLQWTYSVHWRLCPQQGILVWGDGYYNGAIKTRKTVQPMEVSTEEASLQRSQQLRELYESLSAGPETTQTARRPCAALSPEDLTESEWFYLMCVSFSFPPGVGLPGKAFAERQCVWITRANEADSRVFPRAILAKSAGIQTVVCIPLADGVLELGNTEKVEEDLGLIQKARSFFAEQQDPSIHHHHHPKPALSEHSTSNPVSSIGRPLFHSPPLAMIQLPTISPPGSNQDERDDNEDRDDDDDGDDDDEDEGGSDSKPGTSRDEAGNATAAVILAADQPSELVRLDMSEDVRLGSPDDCSNNFDIDVPMLSLDHDMVTGQSPDRNQQGPGYRQPWPSLPDELSGGIPQSSGAPSYQELSQEDAHYSETVSTILQHNPSHTTESCSVGYLNSSQQSAFSSWSYNAGSVQPSEVASQLQLKYILFTVPFLHNKDKNGDGEQSFRKGTPQEELSASHVLAERRRREKLNERFIVLRSLVPFVTKMDKASILGDTIEYVKQLRRRIQELESRARPMEDEQRPNASETVRSLTNSRSSQGNTIHVVSSERSRVTTADRRKSRVLEGGSRSPTTRAIQASDTNLQVSIIEADALLELQCPYREGLLLKMMQKLQDFRLEITSVQSSSSNNVFVAELRAKVKQDIYGKRASIVEVKKAINQIFSSY